jgi:hypothetical protein
MGGLFNRHRHRPLPCQALVPESLSRLRPAQGRQPCLYPSPSASQHRRANQRQTHRTVRVTGRAAVRLTSSRGIASKQTHVIERGLYCFLELGVLDFLERSGIAHRSTVLLDDRG